MKTRSALLCPALIAGYLLFPNALHAAPIEEARAHLAAKRYDQVEASLAPLFEAEEPPVAALALSFEAARATGKVYTAERRVRELIEREGRDNPIWIYEGALVARDLGQEGRSMDRLMFFVRQQREKSPELEHALALLSRQSLLPEAFETYVKLYPQQADFGTGFRMMERLRSNSQPKNFLEIAGVLLANFDSGDQVDRVHRELFDAVQNNMLGLKRDEVYRVMFAGPIHGFDVISEMVGRHGVDHAELLLLQESYGKPLPGYLLGRFDHMDRIDNPNLRAGVARRFLAVEPIYRQSGDPDTYRSYLWRIFSEPNAFIPESGRVITEQQAGAMFKAAAEMHPPADQHKLRWLGRHVVGDFRDNPNRFVQDPELRKSLLRNLPDAFRAEELEQLVSGREGDPDAVRALLALVAERPDARIELLDLMDRNKLGREMAQTVRRELLFHPTTFDRDTLAREFLNSGALDRNAKLSILNEAWERTANAKGLRDLVTDNDHRDRNEEPFKAFVAKLDDNRKPQDPVLAMLYEIERDNGMRGGNEPKPEFNAAIGRAFDAYGKPYPSADAPAERNAYMRRILELYRDTCDNRREGRRTYAEVVAPRLSGSADWDALIEFCIDGSGEDGLATHHVAKAGLKTLGGYREAFRHAWHPENDATPLLEPFYGDMSGDAVKAYLHRNREKWSADVLAAQVASAMAHHNLTSGDAWRLVQLLTTLREKAEQDKQAELRLEVLADQIFEPGSSGGMGSSWDARRELLRLYRTRDRVLEGMDRLVKGAVKLSDPVDTVNVVLSGLYSDRDLIPSDYESADPKPGSKTAVMINEVLPRMRKLSDRQMAGLYLSDEFYRAMEWLLGRGEMPETTKNQIAELRTLCGLAEAAGASGGADGSELDKALRDALRVTIEQGDYPRTVSIIRQSGREFRNPGGWLVRDMIEPLQQAGLMEPLLLFTQLVSSDEPDARTLLNQARALAGSEVQGIYPVDKNDPEYPLYVAADELARNNPDQAWSLLRENLEVFGRDPLQYPHEFVGWALEKLREVKGEEGALLERSLELSNAVLAREDEITPELRARVMLNRALIFREKQDFEAAKLEFKTIRTNPELQGTRFGRRAMFEDVDLMIAMGNNSAAEGLIEYWLSNPDPELQVKAHYFQALMAFNDGDNDATREHLEKVFELDFTNSEARLLHGKWRLRTNYEVDNPEVLLGTLRDRTILRPGQPLRVSVQDQNLSVVGGGTAIPVVIRTSDGGDVEKLNLFPSTRDPKLFRGAMDTVLAAATPNNRLLEINGRDIVSYEIDPQFLADRGMTTTEPKRLRVVDDARLAVSAGAILTEAEQQAMEVERQMSGGAAGGGERRPNQNVRPGNPFYVMVRDRDRSTGQPDSSVAVTVETSSGDRLRNVVLSEITPYSGEYRGEVATALPPPRASASDSAEGADPGAVINVNRDGVWRSRSDGAQGKWLKADTMNSHEIRRVELKTPDAARIAQIRLYGSLMEEERLLGSFPERSQPGGGIKLKTTGANLRNLVEYRRYFSELSDPGSTRAEFAYGAEDHRKRFHLRGAFWLPEDRNLRLRLMAGKPEDKYPMHDLWLDILVDGEKVVGGRGKDLADSVIHVPLTAGGHILEAFGYAQNETDSFHIGLERPDGTVEPIPSEWFSTEANPELAEFLKDKARLSREADGWVATFTTPERLRSVRWEFVQYAGDSVAVSELRLVDAEGKPVLPAATDFTDALGNDVLEIAPGDTISVVYQDEVTSEGQRRNLSRQLSSSFTNGSIAFFFEELRRGDKGLEQTLHSAYRFRPGDDFLVVVDDADLDMGPGQDTVEVDVSTRTGETLTLTAVERRADNTRPDEPVHTGRFQALLRTTPDGTTGGDTLKVSAGDRIGVAYLDRENTSPGIPVTRTADLESVQRTAPVVQLYHTWLEAVEDTSDEARLKLEQIRARTGNRNIGAITTWTLHAMPMAEPAMEQELVPINADTAFPLEIYLPSQAMHSGSSLTLEVLTQSEIDRAAAEGREPAPAIRRMGLQLARGGFRMHRNPEIDTAAVSAPEPNATFGAAVRLRLGTGDEMTVTEESETPPLPVRGNDRLFVRVLGEDSTPLLEKQFQLVSEARIDLKDSGYEAARDRIHLGERFFVEVRDTDRDVSAEMDQVTVEVVTSRHGRRIELALRETMPHSGVFTGVIMPRFLRPEPAPAVEGESSDAAAAEEADEMVREDLSGIPGIEVDFGENLEFRYMEDNTLPIREPGPRTATGSIFEGADGALMAFTKYFPDPDMAVRVQFRLAESLFEMAKDYRKLEQAERSANAIAEGKRILEEALANYPDTALAVEGEYLLANLYQEMAAEKAEEDPELSRTYYQEALSRFSSLLSSWPDSEFAPRAQYHKALCLEKLGDFMRASEEYVKMTYIFPESPLVGEAAIRLATHYYKNEQRYDTAGKIYSNFHRRFPAHPLAPKALFMGAQCHMKQGEVWEQERRDRGMAEQEVKTQRILDEYRSAVDSLETLISDETGAATPEMRAQAMYWAGDASLRALDYEDAYLFLKRTTFEYPETEWARRARGLLLQSAEAFEGLE